MGPFLQGRRIREIIVPSKQVYQYKCNRCRKTWYEDSEVPVASLKVSFTPAEGAQTHEHYETLCPTCASITANYVASLLKQVKKESPDQPRAKREKDEPSSPKPVNAGSALVSAPAALAGHGGPAAPSIRR